MTDATEPPPLGENDGPISAKEKAETLARRAVLAAVGDASPIGTASLLSNGEISLRWSADRGEEVRTIRETAKAEMPTPTDEAPITPEVRWAAFRAIVERLGYHMVDLPTADFQTTFQVDIATGRIIGATEGLHPFQDTASDVVRDVFAAVQNVPVIACARVVAAVEAALGVDDHAAAARVVIDENVATFLGPARSLLDAARRIDVARLPPDVAAEFVLERLVLAGANEDYSPTTSADSEWIRAKTWSSLTDGQRGSIVLLDGCIAAGSGRTEQAYALWKGVASTGAAGSTKAWAWSNMSQLLAISDPDAARFAQFATDAFLEAGDHLRAARAALRHATCMLPGDAEGALRIVDAALAWFDASVSGRDVRAGLLHSRALALLKLRRFDEVTAAALAAAELRAGLQGLDGERASSLQTASIALRAMDRGEEADAREKEADALIAGSGSEVLQLERAAARLATKFDPSRAQALRQEAQRLQKPRIEAILMVLIATESHGTHAERLELLERALQLLRSNRAGREDIDLAHRAIAVELERAGEDSRALTFWRGILANDPLDRGARRNTAALLFKLERWKEAAEHFSGERERFGEAPDILYGEGRALVEAGNAAAAVERLERSVSLCADEDPVKPHAERWLRTALERSRTRDAFGLLFDQRHWLRDLAWRLVEASPGAPLSVIAFDLDNFKTVNDKHGHGAGDEVLRACFRRVLDVVGDRGDAYRRGGDEVVVFMPNTSIASAAELAEEVRSRFADELREKYEGVQPSLSIGVTEFVDRVTPKDASNYVDGLAYEAKQGGKNRVVARPFVSPAEQTT